MSKPIFNGYNWCQFVNGKYIHKCNVILNETVTKLFSILTTCFLPYLNPTSYLNLKTCLYGIPFLQWKGWHELDCKYWRLSVSLTYKSVAITPSIRDTLTSKKLIEVFDFSAVNLMLGCTLLILSINDFNLFSPCSHKKNILSMYLHYRYCLYSDSFVIFSSISAINKMLYRGANLVPIAVPHFCLSVFFLNVMYTNF